MSGADDTKVADIRDALDNPQNAPTMAQPGDSGPELENLERPPFPPACPITPLGISSGLDGSQACYYLNYNGQLVGLEAGNRHGKNSLIALFGPSSDWLEANFPQWSKPVYEGRGANKVCIKQAEIVGFDQAEASRAMIEECSRLGIFDPAGKMRGPGAHRQREGGIVLHCGDKVLASEHYATTGEFKGWQWHDPGRLGDHVYVAATAVPRPWHETVGPRCAQQLLTKLLMTWNVKRPLLDPRLMLGAIGAGMVGGWLGWRPHVFITGGKGTGKSTLNGELGVLDLLFGEGQFRTDNTSAAAIRSSLMNSTVPVFLDELEAKADSRRVDEVVETARVASSGGKFTRSSSEQKTREFTLRSCFWGSAINMPKMEAQDRSRFAVVELRPLREGSPPPVLADFKLPQVGRKLMRRMIDQLFRLEATKVRFHEALQAMGHDSRACDQFGTLLACADVLLHDRGNGLPDDEEVQQWADECRPDRLAEIADEVPAHIECLNHLMTQDVQARGGDERVSLRSWVGAAVRHEMLPLLSQAERDSDDGDDRANKRLQELGLKVVNARWKEGPGEWGTCAYDFHEPGFVAVANSHHAIKSLFGKSVWQDGNWPRTLGRCELALERVTVKFGHKSQRAVLVPLWLVLDDDELPAASQKEAHATWNAAWAEEFAGDG